MVRSFGIYNRKIKGNTIMKERIKKFWNNKMIKKLFVNIYIFQ